MRFASQSFDKEQEGLGNLKVPGFQVMKYIASDKFCTNALPLLCFQHQYSQKLHYRLTPFSLFSSAELGNYNIRYHHIISLNGFLNNKQY